MDYANVHDGGGMKVDFAGTASSGEPIVADFVVRTPPGAGEPERRGAVDRGALPAQLQAQHAAVRGLDRASAARGTTMEPSECHGVQDFGRGVWPYRSFWNWGVATGVQDGVRIGVNVGGKWTTGTGVNENGLLIDGRLHKIMEDLRWDYDPNDWMRPWRVRADALGHGRPHARADRRASLADQPRSCSRTGGVCCFGRWHGTIRFDGQDAVASAISSAGRRSSLIVGRDHQP